MSDLLAEVHTGRATREQVREEILGLFFAGHETLGHTLAWSWHLVARDPAALDGVREEVRRRVGAQDVTLEDTPALNHTHGVVAEAMRLFPVVWLMMRRAVDDDVLAGRPVPAGSWVAWSPYAVNRLADVWPEPDAFRPDRERTARGGGPTTPSCPSGSVHGAARQPARHASTPS